MKAKMKNIKLPPAPYPPAHKPTGYITGISPKHITVRPEPPRPAPIPHARDCRRPILWTDERLKKLADLYNQGLSHEEIARLMNANVGTTGKYIIVCRKKGYITSHREHHTSWTAEEDAVLLRMRQEGCKTKAIAEKLGRSKSSVTSRENILRKRRKK